MRIGELAARTGASVRALRYYEEQDLLVPDRSSSGQRHYPEGALDRVGLIRELYAAGLSSRAILEMLPHAADGRATTALLDRLAEERDRLDARIGELTDSRARLDSVIDGATANLRTGRSCRPATG
ncbi:MerR family transcriptional regulator [Streptomyces parvulus]|uniref:MerR family transcriptional regulator n=1 Tax=Streptomyces parvulus TaxID=146923 RepID=UPI0036C3E24D